MEKLIRNADELVKWLCSLYQLPKHRAIVYNRSGVIIVDDVVREFISSEYQGKVNVNGKTYPIKATSVGYGCSAVSIMDPDLTDDESVRNPECKDVDLEYALREVIAYLLSERSEKSLKNLADQLGVTNE